MVETVFVVAAVNVNVVVHSFMHITELHSCYQSLSLYICAELIILMLMSILLNVCVINKLTPSLSSNILYLLA